MNRSNLRHTRQTGFSLVELLLALALGLVVVTGIVQLFVGNSQTYNVLNGQSRMQESARFALDIISRAARTAGYFGCASSRDTIAWAITGGSIDNSNLAPEFDVARAVQGIEDVDGPGELAPLPTTGGNSMIPANGINADAVIPGTDVLVVRSLETPAWPLLDELFPAPGSNPQISANATIDVGDVVMVSNCEQATVFRVTGAPSGAGRMTLEHAVAGGGPFANASAAVSPIGRTYQEDSLVGRIDTTIFFIAEGAGLDNRDNAPRSLWQKVGANAPVELLQGVEDLQVLYGVDTTDDDGPNANEYVTADNLDPDDADVVALRISVVVNSVDAVTEDGEVLRRTFTRTVLLRNANPEAV